MCSDVNPVRVGVALCVNNSTTMTSSVTVPDGTVMLAADPESREDVPRNATAISYPAFQVTIRLSQWNVEPHDPDSLLDGVYEC